MDMKKTSGLVLGIAFWLVSAFGAAPQAGEPGSEPLPVHPVGADANTDDPFAELLRKGAMEMKIGPSCRLIKIELPPGVTADELADPAKQP